MILSMKRELNSDIVRIGGWEPSSNHRLVGLRLIFIYKAADLLYSNRGSARGDVNGPTLKLLKSSRAYKLFFAFGKVSLQTKIESKFNLDHHFFISLMGDDSRIRQLIKLTTFLLHFLVFRLKSKCLLRKILKTWKKVKICQTVLSNLS